MRFKRKPQSPMRRLDQHYNRGHPKVTAFITSNTCMFLVPPNLHPLQVSWVHNVNILVPQMQPIPLPDLVTTHASSNLIYCTCPWALCPRLITGATRFSSLSLFSYVALVVHLSFLIVMSRACCIVIAAAAAILTVTSRSSKRHLGPQIIWGLESLQSASASLDLTSQDSQRL